MCSKQSGKKKRGCPCRDENLKCAESCSCGMMKAGCKNKSTSSNLETATTHAGKSAFERHNAAVEEAKQQIMVRTEVIYCLMNC